MTTEDALWCAVCARLDDALPRGVLADWYDERNEPGDADTAAGLRATADRVPEDASSARIPAYREGQLIWGWFRDSRGHKCATRCSVPAEVFDHLAGGEWTYPEGPPLANMKWFPTARAALEDLCRAWVAVEATPKCGRCGGAGQVQVYTRDGDYTVEDCWDCSGRAAQGAAGSGVRA